MIDGNTLYAKGSISFTNGSKDIVGEDGYFGALVVGDLLVAPDGRTYEVETITDDDHIGLLTAYAGATVADSEEFVFQKVSIDRDSVSTATRQLSLLTANYKSILYLTALNQELKLNKQGADDTAGLTLRKARNDLYRVGMFNEDDFSIQFMEDNEWVRALTVNVNGVEIESQLALGGVISPPELTGNVHNYAPEGIERANVIRVETSDEWRITGLVGGRAGRIIAIQNVEDEPLILEGESDNSLPENRFNPQTDIEILPGHSILLMYDGTDQRWRPLSGGAGGGGGVNQRGWSPSLSVVNDGARIVLQVTDWEGGLGAKPATGGYVGETGLVPNIEDAKDISSFAWKGNWSNVTTYQPRDVTTRLGVTYLSLSNNINKPPESNPGDWVSMITGGNRYDLGFHDSDRPMSGENVMDWVFTTSVVFNAGMAESRAFYRTAPSGTAIFRLMKNDVEFATVTFTAASNVGVFDCPATTSFAPGDVFSVLAPNPRDETLAGVTMTATGYR